MAAFYMMVFSMLLASTLTRAKAISVYGLRNNAGGSAAVRGKRQTHPAATVARFPEVSASPATEGERDIVPEPIDYLTPPRPPDSAEPLPLPDPPGPIPSRLPDRDLETKWQLGYDPNEILNPPADPYSLVSNSGYTTINVVLRTDIPTKENHRTSPETRPNDSGSQFLGRNNQPNFQTFKEFDFNTPFSRESDFNDFDQSDFFDDPKDRNVINRQRRISVYEEDEEDENRGNEDARDEEHSNVESDHEDDGHHHKTPIHVITFVKTDKHGHYKWGVRQHGIH